jgi:hypothetical protein
VVTSPMGCRFGLTAGLKLASAAKIPKNTSDGINSIAQGIGLIQGVSRGGGQESAKALEVQKTAQT